MLPSRVRCSGYANYEASLIKNHKNFLPVDLEGCRHDENISCDVNPARLKIKFLKPLQSPTNFFDFAGTEGTSE